MTETKDLKTPPVAPVEEKETWGEWGKKHVVGTAIIAAVGTAVGAAVGIFRKDIVGGAKMGAISSGFFGLGFGHMAYDSIFSKKKPEPKPEQTFAEAVAQERAQAPQPDTRTL